MPGFRMMRWIKSIIPVEPCSPSSVTPINLIFIPVQKHVYRVTYLTRQIKDIEVMFRGVDTGPVKKTLMGGLKKFSEG